MEKNLKKNSYSYNWITLLYTLNTKLYFNFKNIFIKILVEWIRGKWDSIPANLTIA